MDKYKLLCVDCGEWSIEDKKTGELRNGVSYYIVAHKEGNCKPLIFKAIQNRYLEAAKYVGMNVNILFDSNGRVAGINPIK